MNYNNLYTGGKADITWLGIIIFFIDGFVIIIIFIYHSPSCNHQCATGRGAYLGVELT
jgi:hypothetical protein